MCKLQTRKSGNANLDMGDSLFFNPHDSDRRVRKNTSDIDDSGFLRSLGHLLDSVAEQAYV